MSMQIVAQIKAPEKQKTVDPLTILHNGGRVTIQSDGPERGYCATVSDAEGQPVRSAFAVTPQGALRRLGIVPPVVLFAPEGAF